MGRRDEGTTIGVLQLWYVWEVGNRVCVDISIDQLRLSLLQLLGVLVLLVLLLRLLLVHVCELIDGQRVLLVEEGQMLLHHLILMCWSLWLNLNLGSLRLILVGLVAKILGNILSMIL